jgi:dTDP-4-dehydrorhamnose reductase
VKIVLAGAEGQLGRELSRLLPARGHETSALSRADLDITDSERVFRVLEQHAPDLMINAAAYTNVDACETETELAYAVNALGPRNLAVGCERSGCNLLHVSTNYVFDGVLRRPYEPFDPPNPINTYGRTKLAGEEYVKHLCNRWYIVRTAGVYGEGGNFVRTMLRLAAAQNTIRVKQDEFVSPTYARDLAGGILRLVESGNYGLYHVANSGCCSWYEFACKIIDLTGANVEAVPVLTSEYPLAAARPANGVLSNLGSPRLRHWREALAEYLRAVDRVPQTLS